MVSEWSQKGAISAPTADSTRDVVRPAPCTTPFPGRSRRVPAYCTTALIQHRVPHPVRIITGTMFPSLQSIRQRRTLRPQRSCGTVRCTALPLKASGSFAQGNTFARINQKGAEEKKRPGVVPRGNLSATPGWPSLESSPGTAMVPRMMPDLGLCRTSFCQAKFGQQLRSGTQRLPRRVRRLPIPHGRCT
jgi:hypothetical protein